MVTAAARLARLESYLLEDPQNPALRADACDAAIEGGLHARALQHLEAGERLAPDPAPWLWRRARLAIAQRALAEAAGYLDRLQDLVGTDAAVTHDRAYVHFLQQDFAACRAVLAPFLTDAGSDERQQAFRRSGCGPRMRPAWCRKDGIGCLPTAANSVLLRRASPACSPWTSVTSRRRSHWQIAR
jgi:hypothetical protein